MSAMLRVAIAGCHRQIQRKPTSHNFASAFCANPDAEVVGGLRLRRTGTRRIRRVLAGCVGRGAGL